ncbi:MAG: penicillin-binding protein 2 [Anaerolineae bacterium]|nr:penicillin-binding protein 2 [Anaerolineae bacterium]
MSRRSQWRQFGSALEAADQVAESAEPHSRQTNDQQSFTNRVRLLVLLFALASVIVLMRLIASQVIGVAVQARKVSAQTVDNLRDSRGRIVDRNGLLLALDVFSWEVYLNPQVARDKGPSQTALAQYANLIGIETEALAKAMTQPGTVAVVARNVSEAQCKIADNHPDVPAWIWCDGKRKRQYPNGSLAAHVLGFADVDQIGRAGVEATYNDWLRVAGDWPAYRLPGPSQPLPEELKTYLPSAGGRDLVLNLNAALQYRVEQILAAAVTRYQAASGTVIVMDPRTGAILALANVPTFDPNRYAQFTAGTWNNSALNEVYEPGSVFKPITFAAAIESGQLRPDDILYDSGKLELDGQTISNAQQITYGNITARQALARSVNVVTAQLCLDMGKEVFYRYLRQFGFGKVTEADCGAENAGIVKWPGTRFWSRYDQAANAFGQGISVTSLQMANAIAAIANGGNLMQPQFVRGLAYNGQFYPLPPRVLGRAIKPETAQTLNRMMTFTVDSYALGPNLVPGYRVAGKTGTAQIPGRGGYTLPLTNTSFVGFLPAADPQILILVKLAEPKTATWAEQVALPVFGEIAREAVQIMKIAPDDRMP